MTNTISQAAISKTILALLDETVETHYGIYLDKCTSLLETLAKIDYVKASAPAGGGCATLAAHVEHIVFYLDVLEKYAMGESVGKQDWGKIWARINTVSESEWESSRTKLRTTYIRVRNMIAEIEDWGTGKSLEGALAIIVHTAYQLGEIRQALCWL